MRLLALVAAISLLALPTLAEDGVAEQAAAYVSFLEAQEDLQAGNLESGREKLERVVALDPSAALARANLARIYLRMGERARALEQARRAVELAPKDAAGHKVLAEIAIARHYQTRRVADLETALTHLGDAAASEPRDASVWVAWIRELARAQRLDEARDVARQASATPGVDPALPWLALARTLLATGNAAESVAVLEGAEVEGRAAVPLLETLAELKAQEGDLPGQARALERLRAQRPGDPALDRRLGRIYLQLGDPFGAVGPLAAAAEQRPADVDLLHDLATAQVRLGEGSAALETLEVLEESQRTLRTLHLLARAARQAEEWVQAATWLEELLSGLDPSGRAEYGTSLAVQGAEAWIEAGEPERALALIEDASRAPGVLRLRLRALGELGRSDEAGALLEQRRLKEPDDPALVALAVERAAREGDQGAALETGLAWLRVRDERHAELARVAQWLAYWGNASLAAALLDAQGLPQDPGEEALRLRAGVLHAAGRLGEAEATYRQLLDGSPEDHGLLNDLGYLLASRGRDLDEAIEMLKRALEAEPDQPAYLDSLGYALLQDGRPEEALVLIRRAAQRASGGQQAEIREHLGDVYLALGDLPRALAEWRAALAYGATERERLLAKIRAHDDAEETEPAP